MENSVNLTKNNRVQWIDICKGYGILLVVLGHTLRTDLSLVYIYGFHMPLFFFLSGIVCDEKKYNWKTFIKSRFNTLCLPYFLFYLITWIYWLVFEKNFRALDVSWYESLLGMFYGAQYKNLMAHNGILWFLPCLFSIEIIFYVIKKNIHNIYVQVLIVVILALIGFNIKINLPWCINIAFVALQFFYFGNFLRTLLLQNWKFKKSLIILGTIVVFAIYILFSGYFGNKVNMATNYYGNIIIFELLSFCGIILLLLVSNMANIKILSRLGGVTLLIFAFHQPLLRIVRYLGSVIFNDFQVETNILFALGADVIVLLGLIPLIYLWNNYGIKILKKIYLR